MLRPVLIAVLAVFLSAASEPPIPDGGQKQDVHAAQPAEHHDNTQSGERGTPKAPFVVQIQQIESQAVPTPEATYKSNWNSPEGWTARFTGGLFIATAALWVFTALLWWSTRRTAQAIVQNERPWVGLQTNKPLKPLAPDRDISVEVMIRNSGCAPALKMRVRFVPCILPKGKVPERPSLNNEPEKALFPNVSDFYYPFHGFATLSHYPYPVSAGSARSGRISTRSKP